MTEEKRKVVIGFITYGKSTAKYLPYFLPSLRAQDFTDYQILAVDNSETEENENISFLSKNYPEIKIIRTGKNIGFAKAFNLMINSAIDSGAKYFLALNPDMMLEPETLSELLKTIESGEKIAAVQPKILRWDFENKQKTGSVDSYGLVIDKKHRFFDDHQGLPDIKPDGVREVFGFTGAAVLLSLEALKDVSYEREYFDELMFMYKEDCDLSYRLRLAGWKTMLAPTAVAYHDRTAAIVGQGIVDVALNRRNKNRQLKKWSFLNNLILLYKIKNQPFSFKVRVSTWYYLLASIMFAAVFETYLLKEIISFIKLRAAIIKKRTALKVRIEMKELEKLMR